MIDLESYLTAFLPETTPIKQPEKKPTVRVYKRPSILVAKATAGDQIAVQNSAGHWHHGIYLGVMEKDSEQSVSIVDVWDNKLSARHYDDFTKNGVSFATIDYENQNLDQETAKQDSADRVW